MCQLGANGRAIKWAYPDLHVPLTPKPGIAKSPSDIAAKSLEIDENVNYSALDKTFSGSEFIP